MPQAPQTTLTNNFIAGLKTEFTGLNFPENAATDTDNCVYTLIGEVLRREGIDYETNFGQTTVDRTNSAISTYKWNNAGGDGSVQIIVVQIGNTLYFFNVSNATTSTPLSTQKFVSTIFLRDFIVGAGTLPSVPDPALSECQFTDGNGYLFVFHTSCQPFYCKYSAGAITSTAITVNIRDFDGVNSDASGLYSQVRPATLANDHQYNLQNQGWDVLGRITTFRTAAGSYPSNSDVWWRYKDSTGVFNPTTTFNNISVSGPAPKGSFIINAFDQVRGATGTPLPEVFITQRPKTGTWFQGRVWYVGADAPAIGAHTFSETIYFSQVIETSDQFGFCYQVNDPTSETLFDLLPTDGGTIRIQGCGTIYKLFPIQNGLLVFAANGIWFITGSQGIGFSANDYTITKISSIQNISFTSYVNAQGFPIFWNEEGIYTVAPSEKGGGLTVDNLTLGTILSFYAGIPLLSKKFARGDYNYVDYEIRWCYRSTNETSITDRYQFDKILVFNTVNKSFSVYTLSQGIPWIHDIRYVAGPGGSTSPDPVFKYLTSALTSGVYKFTFSDEHDTSYKDWKSFDNVGVDFVSTFTTGYRIHGQGTRMWQPGYLYMYTASNSSYKIQNIWDYALNPNSGRWSNLQLSTNFNPNFNINVRRHRLRGHGLANQIRVVSVTGQPFSIQGWTVFELQNTGV